MENGDVYDLLVRFINRRTEISNSGNHPAALNAYKFGLLHGLRVGIFRYEFGYGLEQELDELLVKDGERVDVVLGRINQGIASREKFYHPAGLEPTGYRSSDYKSWYFEGVKLGYEYVFELAKALNPLKTVVINRIREIRNTIDAF